MIDSFGIHRANHAPVICKGRHVGHNFAEPHSAFAVLLKPEGAGRNGEAALAGSHGGQSLSFSDRFGQIFATSVLHLRFWIEQIHLGRCTGLEQVDNSACFGNEVRQPRDHCGVGPCLFGQQQCGQSRGAKPSGGSEKCLAIDLILEAERIHNNSPGLGSEIILWRLLNG